MNVRAARFGLVSLSISLAEILVIWGGVALGLHFPEHNWKWLGNVFVDTYLWAGLGSVVLAVLGLVKDSRKVVALVALFVALCNFAICAPPSVGLAYFGITIPVLQG
jgi:hypothetical protein